MVILQVLAPACVGGLERVVQLLAQGLRDRGHEVHVAAVLTEGASHPFVDSLRAAGLSTWPVVVSARGYLGERGTIREVCRQLRPAIVHTHGYRPDVVDAGIARSLGIPVVSTLHGFTGGGWRNRFYEWVQRMAARRMEAVVAVSRPMARALAQDGIAPDRVRLIQNAWKADAPSLDRAAARRVLGVPDDRFLGGWVGRLSHEKGPDVFLDALWHLRHIPIFACVVGDGSDRAALKRRAARLGLSDLVEWNGTVPGAGRFFAAFDCFVLSSRTEGTPIVLFEAMAAGVPIVAADVGGVPDIIGPQEALLVRRDDAEALAGAMRAVHEHPEAARVRACHARERLAREFAVDPWLERYEALYEDVCARWKRGHS